jgi:hypothetical protein
MDTNNDAMATRIEDGKFRLALADLEVQMSRFCSDASPDWLREFCACFESLRAHMIKLMAMEEKEGYLAEIAETQPRLAAGLERLLFDHRRFSAELQAIHNEAVQLSADDRPRIRRCCERVQGLLELFAEHGQAEDNALHQAFSQDIGTIGH